MLRIDGPAKYPVLLGAAVVSMLGYKLAAPAKGLPIVGAEYMATSKAFRPFSKSQLTSTLFDRRIRVGERQGLSEFYVQKGDKVVFDYLFQTECGSLSVSVDFAGALKRLPNRTDYRQRVRESGQGRFSFTMPESGVYRVITRGRGPAQCGSIWALSWKVSDGDV